nr:ubiquinol-cytochrome C chaperone family protein [uncultured Gellertiella sp.]
MIFERFRNRRHNQAIAIRQYEALTSASRLPLFFTDYGIPDTVMGRFEMVTVVMILFFRRTSTSPTSGQELAQAVIDLFFQDLDHAMRELGIGDVGVPKRMKKFAGMFYGRLESYARALEDRDAAALVAALRRNVHPGIEDAPDMTPLALYMLNAEAGLKQVTEDEIATGSLILPAPENRGDGQ